MFANDYCCSNTCSSSRSQNACHDTCVPNKKIGQVLDSELRLRSITNKTDYCYANLNIARLYANQNHIGRFDELTNFFNIIHGLFHQPAFTIGLSTYHLAPLFHLSGMNVGVIMQIDQESLEQRKVDLLKMITLYSLIGRNEVEDTDRQLNMPVGIVRFHTIDNSLMLNVNHRWTPSLTTTFRFGTKPQQKLWSHIEYRHPNRTYELIGEYTTQHSSGLQFSYLSCLWQRMNYQIDGGFDLKITSREKLIDVGIRLKRSSDSIIFKCDLYRPFEQYLIGIQRCIKTNFVVGLLAEKVKSYHQQQQQPIKFSLMSQWHLNRIGLRINTLINTQNEFGIGLTHQTRHFPLILQIFGLYSWTTHKCKWGAGLQILL